MKTCILIAIISIISNVAFADQYFTGKIERVEVCNYNGGKVYLFFKDITQGSAPPSTDGCTSGTSSPYVRINNETNVLSEFEKVMVSTALSAQATNSEVRVRYDDNVKLVAIAITN